MDCRDKKVHAQANGRATAGQDVRVDSDGQLLDDSPPREEVQAAVLSELLELRRQTGRLTTQKFSHHSTLQRVCGGGDLLDAYLMFERELRRLGEVDGDRDLAAAALSLTAPADSVLDRLQLTIETLSTDEWRDQRTARRWADRGMPALAQHLVHVAELQGRLGRELLSIEVRGGSDGTLQLVIEQLTTLGLKARSPLVRLWTYPETDEQPSEAPLTLDLEHVPSRSATGDKYSLNRFRLHVDIPSAPSRDGQERILTVSIEGRDAPMRSVFYADKARPPAGQALRASVFRTVVTVDLECSTDA